MEPKERFTADQALIDADQGSCTRVSTHLYQAVVALPERERDSACSDCWTVFFPSFSPIFSPFKLRLDDGLSREVASS